MPRPDSCGEAIARSIVTNKISKEEQPMTIPIRVRGIDRGTEQRGGTDNRVRRRPIRRKPARCLGVPCGPEWSKGGVDKLCRITATLNHGSPVRILEKGTEVLPTVNQAARRLRNRIGRNIQRSNRPELRKFRESIRAA